VRTNSEAIIAVTGPSDARFCDGIAITSGIKLKDGTHVEVVTYNDGSDGLSPLGSILVDGGGKVPRFIRFLGAAIRRPWAFLKSLWPFGWARRSIVLLCMQTDENQLKLKLRGNGLRSMLADGTTAIPTYIPAAHELARNMADRIGGEPGSSIFEVLSDTPTTAHILGGAIMGETAEQGVIDAKHRVFGYDNFYISDGSCIGGNLGVNPSLTITSLTERAMSFIPVKEGHSPPEWTGRVLYLEKPEDAATDATDEAEGTDVTEEAEATDATGEAEATDVTEEAEATDAADEAPDATAKAADPAEAGAVAADSGEAS
jgi:cholesterol oxidase